MSAGHGDWDAVVCGAGVAGLATARALDLLGLRVLVLEKQRAPAPIAKGEVLQPSSLDVLERWQVLPRLAERGAVPLERLMVRDGAGRRLMLFDYLALPGAHRGLLALDYPLILAALRESLRDRVEVWPGALVEAAVPAGGRLSGVRVRHGGRVRELTAPLLVAADGRSSRLRAAAGIEARPVAYPHRLLSLELADVPEQAPEVTSYLTDQGLRLAYPLPGHRLRLYAQVPPDALRGADPAQLRGWASGLLDGTPALRPLAEQVRAGLGSRQLLGLWRYRVARLAVPGLALTGEAAHCVHPMAAQGMNTAIADAAALADCLAEQGFADRPSAAAADRALLAYHGRRRSWVRHIDLMSHDATLMVTRPSWTGRLIGRQLLRRIDRNPRLRFQATYNLAGLGIRPFTALDRLHQLGLPDPRAGRVPAWT
ncbi:FAD-dependent oxidoreductase [Kitasatospora viridis]|uniref:2-polyprenyl-6-methoxyphenol hydroxylase-like FAD-dependent oxidoreductase n=1 Tax=Kitasatospora viridis TaxID=281105 RepID=A0A561T6U3_9ACTN|nr:NAD(P)/FAD-dependent oxidoreductase [Kitasatospora viridis]TWF82812.1 2-polyprenyl-6-methoxyphenol hydroxylase-like FAD-dependent oxidoreductase [Kitasatospora viridis]